MVITLITLTPTIMRTVCMSKELPIGNRLMDRAWLRDGSVIHSGEALVLACLLAVRKERTQRQEEELKEVMDVYSSRKTKNPRRSKKN